MQLTRRERQQYYEYFEYPTPRAVRVNEAFRDAMVDYDEWVIRNWRQNGRINPEDLDSDEERAVRIPQLIPVRPGGDPSSSSAAELRELLVPRARVYDDPAFDFLDRDPYMIYSRHIQVEAEEDAARGSQEPEPGLDLDEPDSEVEPMPPRPSWITVLNLVQPQDVVSESSSSIPDIDLFEGYSGPNPLDGTYMPSPNQPYAAAAQEEEEEEPADTERRGVVRGARPSDEQSEARSVRQRRANRVEPDAERTPSRRPSTGYDVTNDLPDQLHVRFEQARRDQAEQPSGVPFAGKVTRSNFMDFMANRILPRELVEHQEEFKNLPGILNYYKATPYVRRCIDGSRGKEWQKYVDFPAAIPIKGKDLSDLLADGHVPIPMKWVDTMKNIHEQHKPDFVPDWKSRLVGCGNFEDAAGVRTDAPASDLETHSVVAAFAACIGVPIQSSDIKNAYFQALPIDRIVIMRQPAGGLPGVDPEAYLLVRVPVYGLCDSGRGFWKKVDKDAKEVGLRASRIFPAFYFHCTDGRVDLVLTTHVDDFLWACTETGQVVIQQLLDRFDEVGTLRFCGKQFDRDDKDVLIDVADNTTRTTCIDIGKESKDRRQDHPW